jgi:hypothetical protein
MKIAPSLLAADFSKLGEEMQDIENGGADLVHLDIMDGRFVPNISFGPPVIQALRPITKLPFDVHLMIYHPEDYFDILKNIGVEMASFHIEAVTHVDRVIHALKSANIKCGLAVNPGTSLSMIDTVLPLLDYVLIMSVNPGFGGQKFIPYAVDKVKQLKKMITEKQLSVSIEVDGGVNQDNAFLLKNAGADILVAGSSVFGKSDRAKAIHELRV